jgi:hypothetical protein
MIYRRQALGRQDKAWLRADRVQMESSGRVKMLAKQQHRAGCVNPGERKMLYPAKQNPMANCHGVFLWAK